MIKVQPPSSQRLLTISAAAITAVLAIHLTSILLAGSDSFDLTEAQAQSSLDNTSTSPAANFPTRFQKQADSDAQPTIEMEAPTVDKKSPRDAEVAAQFNNQTSRSSRSEIGMLVAQRRSELNRREAELKAREVLLKSTERNLDTRLARLENRNQQLAKNANVAGDTMSSKLKKMATVYGSMKPKDAARLFNSMDETSLMLIVSRLEGRKLAPIMAAMSEKSVHRITANFIGVNDSIVVDTPNDKNSVDSTISELQPVQ